MFTITVFVAVFSLMISFSDSTVSAETAETAKQDKVDVNHKGKIISISINALPAHLAHGDEVICEEGCVWDPDALEYVPECTPKTFFIDETPENIGLTGMDLCAVANGPHNYSNSVFDYTDEDGNPASINDGSIVFTLPVFYACAPDIDSLVGESFTDVNGYTWTYNGTTEIDLGSVIIHLFNFKITFPITVWSSCAEDYIEAVGQVDSVTYSLLTFP